MRCEKLGSTEGWRCPVCKRVTTTTKQLFIETAPEGLILHLERFRRDAHTTVKLDTNVAYQHELVLTTTTGDASYELQGVVCHTGGSWAGGHYYAYVRQPRGAWLETNDQTVSPIDTNGVLGARASKRRNNGQAYMLFYSRTDGKYAAGGLRAHTSIMPHGAKSAVSHNGGKESTGREEMGGGAEGCETTDTESQPSTPSSCCSSSLSGTPSSGTSPNLTADTNDDDDGSVVELDLQLDEERDQGVGGELGWTQVERRKATNTPSTPPPHCDSSKRVSWSDIGNRFSPIGPDADTEAGTCLHDDHQRAWSSAAVDETRTRKAHLQEERITQGSWQLPTDHLGTGASQGV
eukprot:57067-Eustigmatos_ZCMA.PRE.1